MPPSTAFHYDPHEVGFLPDDRANDAPDRDGYDVDLARALGCGVLDFNHVTGNVTVAWSDLQRALSAGTLTPASVWVDGATMHAAGWLDHGPGGKAWRVVASTVATVDQHLRFAPRVGGGR